MENTIKSKRGIYGRKKEHIIFFNQGKWKRICWIKNNFDFNDQYYKDLVLKYINDFGSITKKDLDELLMDKLPDSLNEEQKKRKIRYLVNEILNKKEQKIKNIGTTRYSIWTLKKQKLSRSWAEILPNSSLKVIILNKDNN